MLVNKLSGTFFVNISCIFDTASKYYLREGFELQDDNLLPKLITNYSVTVNIILYYEQLFHIKKVQFMLIGILSVCT